MIDQNSKIDIKTTFTNDDLKKIAEAIKAVGRIVAQTSSVEKEEPILHATLYYDPRPPKRPPSLKAFFDVPVSGGKNTFCNGAILRKHGDTAWYNGGVDMYIAIEKYKMGINKQFYDYLDIELVRSEYVSPEENERRGNRDSLELNTANIFYYRPKHGDQDIQYIFYSDPEFSNIKDGYPKSFYSVDITNNKVKDKKVAWTPEAELTCRSGQAAPCAGIYEATIAQNHPESNYVSTHYGRWAKVDKGERLPTFGLGKPDEAEIVWRWIKPA